MVKQSDGGWRMCVDFTDINKACPKDCYPLPEIDWKVESLSGFRLKCFLDAYKGYHQIQIAEGDEDKTAIFTGEGVFWRNLEAYVSDMVIESTSEEEMLADIKETFEKFCSINMKLNPKKCSFGVEEGPFLGHLITNLNGKIAALSCFLSKGVERSLLFFKVLKSCTYEKTYNGYREAEASLQDMNKFIEILPSLTTPVQGKVLMMYLTASTESISAALFAKREEEQVHIHFVSRVLQGAKLNNPGMEKLILALVHAAMRLQRYFQANMITVLINSPIKQTLMKPEKSRRVAKWTIELGEHDIVFQERGDETPKDFLIEVPLEDNKKEAEEKADTNPTKTELSCEWKLCTDIVASFDGFGAGLMTPREKTILIPYALDSKQQTTKKNTKHYWPGYEYHKRWKLQAWQLMMYPLLCMGIHHTKPYTLRGGTSTKLEQRSDSQTHVLHLHQGLPAKIEIVPGFVEANYESLKSLFRNRRRQMCNNDIRIKLEYFSEDYNEEREMEPRPEPTRAATPPFRVASPRPRRRGERTVGFECDQSRGESKVKRNTEGGRTLEEAPRGNGGQSLNLPPLLAAYLGRGENGQPLKSSLTSVYRGQALPNNIGGNLPPNGDVLNPIGLVTPFVCWIEDLLLLYGLKMPSHIDSYDGKGDLYNFLHLFEGAIRMQKWLLPVACHMFTYTLKNSAKIWWNSQKASSIIDYEDLKAKFRSHFSQQKKFTKTHLAVHNIKQRESKSTRAFITIYIDDTLHILGLHENQRILSFVHGLRTRSLVEHLSTDLPSTYKGLIENTYTWVKEKEVATNGASSDQRDSFESLSMSPKEILATEKAARNFEPLPKMFKSKRSRDMSKYCHFHEDYVHYTNDCRHLRTQIQEVVKSGQLLHLVKGIKKERTKSSDTPRGESKKDKGTTPAEAPMLMVNNAPVIIEAKIFGRKVGQVYMTNKSSCEIIYEHCFEKLNPTIKATKVDLKTPLVGFSRERSWSIGEVPLEITIRDAPLSRTKTLNFIIVRSHSSHNMLLGRTAMQRMGIVVLTIYGTINFIPKKGSELYFWQIKLMKERRGPERYLPQTRKGSSVASTLRKKFIINDKYRDQTVTIEKQLPEHFKKELQNLLRSNADVFAWIHADMTGIPRTIMVEGKPFNTKHKLNEYNHVKPIKQNKRDRLENRIPLRVPFKVLPGRLQGLPSNPNGRRRRRQNSLLRKRRSLLLQKMLFGLKNAGATYQRLVDKVFSHQIGRNLKAYVDDMVIKSTSEKEMLKDIQETFERFRSINMKLNQKKCSFGVEEGPFLGHLITKQGIKANPSKVKAVTDLDQPRTLKDIQSLNGKLAALSRFLFEYAKRSLAFFKVLKGCKDKKSIQWTTKADKALEKMKKLVQALPTLTAPRAGETLTIHLAALKESINVVLPAKRNEGRAPIYFVSRVLQGAELNYPALEKLVLALVHTSIRIQRYFQAYTITVLTNTPIKQMLTGPEKTIPFEDNEKKEKPKEVPDSSSKWRLYTDGASNSEGSGAGLMLIDPKGKEYTYALLFEFETMNNETEYKSLLAGLRIVHEIEIAKVAIFLDSQLLVNQIKGTYTAKQTSIKYYLQKFKILLRGFEEYTVEHVRRNQNKKSDALSKLASMTFEHLTKEVLVKILTKRLIEEKEVLKVDMQERKSWMDPIHEYLLSGLLPEDTKEARKIRIQEPQYSLI
ncbi:reverse transcriptase domain-containing protein [Tanacetum coccineum]